MTPIPRRIQLRRTQGWRIPPNTVSVARPTAWGTSGPTTSRRSARREHRLRTVAQVASPAAINPKPGEKFCIWVGDSLIQIEVGGAVSNSYDVTHPSPDKVTIRYRGVRFEELLL